MIPLHVKQGVVPTGVHVRPWAPQIVFPTAAQPSNGHVSVGMKAILPALDATVMAEDATMTCWLEEIETTAEEEGAMPSDEELLLVVAEEVLLDVVCCDDCDVVDREVLCAVVDCDVAGTLDDVVTVGVEELEVIPQSCGQQILPGAGSQSISCMQISLS